ncbi:MAG: hypothetical protein ABIQ44_00825, partial [Chloroflexia bacterium]
MPGIYSQLSASIRTNKAIALCTATTAPYLGAKLLVPGGPNQPPTGTIHPDLDTRIATDARSML